MDLSKLTPAPWYVEDSRTGSDMFIYEGDIDHGAMILSGEDRDFSIPVIAVSFEEGRFKEEPEDLEFIALARNAFDVMMRRGWTARMVTFADGWGVCDSHGSPPANFPGALFIFDDPFTALVEADKWYRENVENRHDACAAEQDR